MQFIFCTNINIVWFYFNLLCHKLLGRLILDIMISGNITDAEITDLSKEMKLEEAKVSKLLTKSA